MEAKIVESIEKTVQVKYPWLSYISDGSLVQDFVPIFLFRTFTSHTLMCVRININNFPDFELIAKPRILELDSQHTDFNGVLHESYSTPLDHYTFSTNILSDTDRNTLLNTIGRLTGCPADYITVNFKDREAICAVSNSPYVYSLWERIFTDFYFIKDCLAEIKSYRKLFVYSADGILAPIELEG